MKISEKRLKVSAILHDLDKILAILGTFISVLMIVRGVVIGQIESLFIGFLLLLSFLLWLAIRKSDLPKFPILESKSQVHFWAICFLVLYILSILTNYLRPNLYERPLLYFILTAGMAGAISCEILAAERRHIGYILIQVMLLGMSIVWTQLLITPGLVGVDPWYFSNLNTQILDQSFLPIDAIYSKLPIFNIIIVVTSFTTTLPYKFATLMSVSFAQIFCNAVFIFIIANYLFKNHRIGLLAALLVIISDQHILRSYWSIPNSFAAIFIPIILYLLYIRIKDTPRIFVAILVIVMMTVLILTHSIVALSMAILLFVAWGSMTFYRYFYMPNENYITLLVPFGFTLAMVAWWTYITRHIWSLANFIKLDFTLFAESGSSLTRDIVIVPNGEIFFSDFGTNIIITISLIGILYMISRKGDSSTFSIALVSVSIFFIIAISYISQSLIMMTRWLYIAEILMSVPLALAIYSVGIWKIKKPIYLYSFFLVFIIVLSFFMLMSIYGNNDNHTFTQTIGSSNFYTQSEMKGSEFFAKKTTGPLSSDWYFLNQVFNYMYLLPIDLKYKLQTAINTGTFNHDDSVKIVRARFISEFQAKGYFSSKIRPNLDTYLSNEGFDKIYDSSAMTGYIG